MSKYIKPFTITGLVVLFGAAAFSGGITIQDDLWYHLLSGRYMYVFKEIPQSGFLVYGHSTTPMLYHSWLVQIMFYILYKAGGLSILKGLNMVLAVGAGLALYQLTLQRASAVSFLILLPLTSFCSNFFLNLRPNVFSFILFTVILILLTKFRQQSNRLWLVTVMVAISLWSVLHGFWVYGLILLFIFGIDALLKKDQNQAIAIGISILLVLVWAKLGSYDSFFVLPENGVKIINNNFHEWLSPVAAFKLFFDVQLKLNTVLSIALFRLVPPFLLMALVGYVLFKTKSPRLEYLLGLTFIALTLFSYRNMMFLIPIFLYIVAPFVDDIIKKTKWKKALIICSVLLSLTVLCYLGFNFQSFNENRMPLDGLTAKIPLSKSLIIADATTSDYILFLINRNFWHDDNYVLWDIRGELYKPEEIAYYKELFLGELDNLPIKEKTGLNPIFILEEGTPLLGVLSEHKDYKVIGQEDEYYLIVPRSMDYISGYSTVN